MKKIIVIGCCGSGKSTLSLKMSEITGLPVVHLDKLYWRKGWTPVTSDEFDRLLKDEMSADVWIMDGNFDRTVGIRLNACDTVIFLDFPSLFCLFRVLKRVVSTRGRVRPDMGDGCPERFDFSFLIYTLRWASKNRKKIYRLLGDAKGKKIFILKSPRQVNDFISHLETSFSSAASV